MKDGPIDRLPIPLDLDDVDEIGDRDKDDTADLATMDFAVSPRQLAVGGAIVAAILLAFIRSRRRAPRSADTTQDD